MYVCNNIAWRESEMHEDVKRETCTMTRAKAKAKADGARTGRTSDDSAGRTDGRAIVRGAGERRPTRRHSEDGQRSG